jgi:hypothetical protein
LKLKSLTKRTSLQAYPYNTKLIFKPDKGLSGHIFIGQINKSRKFHPASLSPKTLKFQCLFESTSKKNIHPWLLFTFCTLNLYQGLLQEALPGVSLFEDLSINCSFDCHALEEEVESDEEGVRQTGLGVIPPVIFHPKVLSFSKQTP